MTRRSTNYFDVGGTTYGATSAKYLGGDGFGEGDVGRKYNVFVYNSAKLEAPNPPFHTDEGGVIKSEDLVKAIEHLLKERGKKPKPGKKSSKSKSKTLKSAKKAVKKTLGKTKNPK